MKLLVFWYNDSFCDCQMLCLAGSYETPKRNKLYFVIMFGCYKGFCENNERQWRVVDVMNSFLFPNHDKVHKSEVTAFSANRVRYYAVILVQVY